MIQDKRREEIAKNVAEIRQHAQYCSEYCCDGKIADFILSRETAMLERIRKPLEELKATMKSENAWVSGCRFEKKVDETLSVLNELQGKDNTGKEKEGV